MEKVDLINRIIELSNESGNTEFKKNLEKWNKTRLVKKFHQLNILNKKELLIQKLRLYGDSYSSLNMNISTLKSNLEYVGQFGNNKRVKERLELIIKLNPIINSSNYKTIIILSVKELRNRVTQLHNKLKKKKLVYGLFEKGYTKKYLQHLTIEELQNLYKITNSLQHH